jgi:hypothetical protein
LLATQAVEGHRCAAQARDGILGHRLYDTRFPFLAKTGDGKRFAMYVSLSLKVNYLPQGGSRGGVAPGRSPIVLR